MRPEKFLTEAEQERVHQAVIVAESKTSGEIVPMVVTSSARYTEIELFGVVTGLFLGMLLGWFWHDPWESYRLNLWPVIGATLGFLIARIPAVKRRLASKSRVEEAVNDRCLAAFTEHGLHYTRDHTGILILVSLLEHRVEVLADRGINEKVPPGTWNEVVEILTAGLKSRDPGDAFCKAVGRCGEILATHFPRQADDRDELPNKIVSD
ncbi:MAG TPA: TPM domain-containing protein [Candidatus Polarisedimenticolaceae bacterium]|nr:TPM domain-containing protein [Candidatus Polarisedimenticolaceae bacterium]